MKPGNSLKKLSLENINPNKNITIPMLKSLIHNPFSKVLQINEDANEIQLISQITGKIAQVKTKIMLDSGALTINAMSSKFYKMNKTRFDKYSERSPPVSNKTLTGAGGNKIHYIEKRKFTIEIAKKTWEDEFHIIENLPFEVLLGGKTMQERGIDLINSQNAVSCPDKNGKRVLIKYSSIVEKNQSTNTINSIKRGQLSFLEEETTVNKETQELATTFPKQGFYLRLEESLDLHPGTETMVSVVAPRMPLKNKNQTILVSSCNPVIENNSVFTAQGVAHIRKGKTQVAVANLGVRTAKFRKGDLIAGCELLPEEVKLHMLNIGDINHTTTGENSRYVNLLLASVAEKSVSTNEQSLGVPLTDDYLKEQLKEYNLPKEIRVGLKNINQQQLTSLLDMLHNFKDSFAINPDQPGNVPESVAVHTIDTGDAKPINIGPRRASPAQRKAITEHIKSMLEAGIIEESRSPWAAPVLLVPKPTVDGVAKFRFCVDYRSLNQVTRKEVFALPRIDDCIDGLGGSMWLSTLDMASGYFQVPMEESSKEKTAFITYDGQYQFTKMSFGLVNAPSTYQRMMQAVLAGLQWKCLQVYLDDIIIASATFQEHLTDLTATLSRLENSGLKLKASKCEFCCSEVKYLGHLITREGVKANPEKIEKVKNWVTPTSSAELEAFVGLAGYYRKLIKDFAAREAPLRDVLKVKPFLMSSNAIEAFEDLKEALSKNPVLTLPDFSGNSKFEVHTDASDRGISAVLTQISNEGKEQVVQYASRMLTKTELKWHTQEKEALAIVWGCHKFRSYLLGSPFIVRTDHKSLQWLWRSEKGKLARWALSMSEFEYTIEYRAGSKNANADVLSRWPTEQPTEEFEAFPDCANGIFPDISLITDEVQRGNECQVLHNNEETVVGPIELTTAPNQKDKRPRDLANDIMEAQKHCDAFISAMSFIIDGDQEGAIEAIFFTEKSFRGYQLVLHEDLLCRVKCNRRRPKVEEDIQIMIPNVEPLQLRILELCHDHPASGHFGFTKTFAKVASQYCWLNMKTQCHDFCKSCPSCQAIKTTRPNPYNRPLKPSLPNHPWERIGVDLIGPLPETEVGFNYALTMVDYFTKYAIAIPIKNKTGEEVANAIFKNLYMVYGIPEHIGSDQGNEFTNDILGRLNQRLDIGHRVTSPYYPQSNGLVERYNKTLKQALSAFCDQKPGNWDWYIESVTFAYNSSLNAVTSFSPYYLLFGRHPRLPSSVLFSRNYNEIVYDIDQYQIHMTEHLRTAYDIVRSKLKEYAIKSKIRWDAKIKGHTIFKIGEEVLVFNPKINACYDP